MNNLKQFMESRSNSSRPRNKRLELEPLWRTNYSSLETGCDLSLQRLSYKSTENDFKKFQSSKIQTLLKTNIFKSNYRHLNIMFVMILKLFVFKSIWTFELWNISINFQSTFSLVSVKTGRFQRANLKEMD